MTLIRARQPDQQYEVDAAHGKLWILANDSHVNFRVAEADPAKLRIGMEMELVLVPLTVDADGNEIVTFAFKAVDT